MIRAEQHLAAGRIAQRSGAAVAALKARALAWEAPIRETPEGLRLSVWGAELRLIAEPQGWRIELAAPEARLIGTLRDSATELFAEIGLNVAWDHVDVGALAPGLSADFTVWNADRPAQLVARLGLNALHLRVFKGAVTHG